MLKLCDIVKNYTTATTTVHALKGVSLTFREHEFVSILGPSGCGKTTLLNIIGGLDRYTDGDLIIGGVSTADFDDMHWDAYRNSTIGFVFQSYNLIPHLTVLENVELALSLVGEKKKVRRIKAIEALQRVGMEAQIHSRPNQLSGGQMQRVAIARAIVNDPKIILADEPTGALDSELSEQVMDILKEIAATRLVIMVTHNADLADAYSTRICRFKDGLLVEDTNPYVDDADLNTSSADCDRLIVEDERINANSKNDTEEEITADTSTLNGAEKDGAEGINATEAETQPDDVKKKRVSNRKCKKQMKRINADKNEVFDKLGLNSLSRYKKKKEKQNRTFKSTSMSAGMAFGLSMRNLISKKRRTFLTAFAGSIGIIGLGLVLSISNGFSVFVEDMQREMLSGVPLCVYEYNIAPSAVMDVMSSMSTKPSVKPAPPQDDKIVIENGGSGSTSEMLEMMQGLINSFFSGVKKNDLSEDFASYMKDMPEEYAEATSTYYGLRYNLITQTIEDTGEIKYSDISQQPATSSVMTIAMSILGSNGVQPQYWQMLVGGEETMLDAYELIGGSYPQAKEELVLCVGENNQIDEKLLETFGITLNVIDGNGNVQKVDKQNVTADFFIGRKIRLIFNDNYYRHVYGSWFEADKDDEASLKKMYDESEVELTVVGVMRPKQDSTASYVSSAICYTPELSEFVLENAYNSIVAKEQRQLMAEDPDSRYTVFGATSIFGSHREDDDFNSDILNFTDIMGKNLGWTSYLKAIGAIKAPTFVKVYPKTYDQKINASEYIKDWTKNNKGEVGYFDVSEMFIYNLVMVIDLVSIILIAVASISLVVSTVMIGVITSNSVIERTREIGILRSLGARKRDIRNVFIAETSLIGLAAGVIGILLTYLLCPIISAIIGAISNVPNLLHFHPLHALLLVALSLVLTVISGILPAIGASRKNVVDALRVE